MRGWKGVLAYTLLYIYSTFALKASDSLDVSLLTCSPGTEVYALYGHTALRCVNHRQHWDLVFNYGVFDFRTPHFAWRFALGECDYLLDYRPTEGFVREYAARGSAVVEQKLNLVATEKEALLQALAVNLLPENVSYRYNFLYNNCTTRVRDLLENVVEGELVYPASTGKHTYRDIIHQYTQQHPWAELGNDLCLGAEVDRPLTVRQEMFAPLYYSDYADRTQIRDRQGRMRPLVSERTTLVHQRPVPCSEGFPLSPAACAWLLFVCVAGLTTWEVWHRRALWPLDALLMFAQGAAGCIIAFLFFFSEHPAVGSNWQLVVLNPLPLLFLPGMIRGALRGRRSLYPYGAAPVLTLFIVFSSVIPQDFSTIIVPLACTLLLRSLSRLWFYKRNSM